MARQRRDTFTVNAYYERSMRMGWMPRTNEFVHPQQGSPTIRETLQNSTLEVDDQPPWAANF